MTKTRRWMAKTLLVTAIVILGVGPASASEDVPFVDGEMWQATAAPLKRAYLIGVANFLSAEYVFQKKNGFPPDSQSSIRSAYEGIDDVTLDEAIARIDGWYAKNPEKNDTAVLEVIWLDMVEPNQR
jgi:hypothetical protein